jgi:hypothetical protein
MKGQGGGQRDWVQGNTSFSQQGNLPTENKYLIVGSECFHKLFQLFIVEKIYTENSSV